MRRGCVVIVTADDALALRPCALGAGTRITCASSFMTNKTSKRGSSMRYHIQLRDGSGQPWNLFSKESNLRAARKIAREMATWRYVGGSARILDTRRESGHPDEVVAMFTRVGNSAVELVP